MLRPTCGGGYGIIGEADCDGFMDGEALLGPIPQAFITRSRYSGRGFWYWNYLNQNTGLFQAEDPRLGPSPPSWSVKPYAAADFKQWIVNDETGEETCPDPRLLKALIKRGVPSPRVYFDVIHA